MHVAHRLGKTVTELYDAIDSPVEITEWLTFFGDPHLPKQENKNKVSNDAFRAWVQDHNSATRQRERIKNGSKDR